MKKIFFIILVFLFMPFVSFAEEIINGYPSDGLFTSDGSGGATISGNVTIGGTLGVGSILSTESSEVTLIEKQCEDDLGNSFVCYSMTVEMTDETDGTEDAVMRQYVMVGGTLGLWRSTKVYAAAPTGSEAPVLGAVVWCDGATWDPTDTSDGIMQQVWYDGDSWEKMGDPAD